MSWWSNIVRYVNSDYADELEAGDRARDEKIKTGKASAGAVADVTQMKAEEARHAQLLAEAKKRNEELKQAEAAKRLAEAKREQEQHRREHLARLREATARGAADGQAQVDAQERQGHRHYAAEQVVKLADGQYHVVGVKANNPMQAGKPAGAQAGPPQTRRQARVPGT